MFSRISWFTLLFPLLFSYDDNMPYDQVIVFFQRTLGYVETSIPQSFLWSEKMLPVFEHVSPADIASIGRR